MCVGIKADLTLYSKFFIRFDEIPLALFIYIHVKVLLCWLIIWNVKFWGINVAKVKMFDVIPKTLANVKHVPELGETPISFRLILLFGLWIFCISGFMKTSKRVLVLI